jgi:hypothetical protein
MSTADQQIRNAAGTISENIAALEGNRKLMSRNIIKQLRDLTEGVIVRFHTNDGGAEFNYDSIKAGLDWIKSSRKSFNFLSRFHKLLQMSESHYTFEGDVTERLMLKYFDYLMQIRTLLHNECDIDVLENLEAFPIDLDDSLAEYHRKIAERVDAAGLLPASEGKDDHYYVHSVRPFVAGSRVLYEVTFTNISDNPNKFDRVIAFTSIDMGARYAAHLLLTNDEIEVFGRKMPITIVRGWRVAIRPCELNHFAEILGLNTAQSRTAEYHQLMAYLTATKSNLLDLMEMSDARYERIRSRATESSKTPRIFPALDKARTLVATEAPGANVLRYLMLEMNNRIIKLQQDHFPNRYLSNLYLTSRSRPFDSMPYAAFPAGHVPRLASLFECIPTVGREHELLGRRITTNVEQRAMLYTPVAELSGFEELDNLIGRHNDALPPTASHAGRTLEKDKGHVFMRQYEEDTASILERLQSMSASGVSGHDRAVERWLDETPLKVDDEVKKDALKALFLKSRVALVYGAAGTGKSTMANYIGNYLGDNSKLYLAHTNPAKANLERKVVARNAQFSTIASHISRGTRRSVDVLIVDECSIVSNSDMLKVLERTTFQLLVLIGDVYQIESIQFGNWFGIAPKFLPRSSVFELTKPWRTDDGALLDFWAKVRALDDGMEEVIAHHGYSSVLDDSLFVRQRDDEIILCLNYDGLYGINNINRFLQAANTGKTASWGAAVYKIGDPVVFGNSARFSPLIFNNLKGKIADLSVGKDYIQFDVALDRRLTELDVLSFSDLTYVRDSTVRFKVYSRENTDSDDEDLSTVVPFQIAYAVSIHRSQGLEYDSVKVVITDANEDDITHGIFYTAITRARENLKIYWTPETQQAVLSQLEHARSGKDVALLKARKGF